MSSQRQAWSKTGSGRAVKPAASRPSKSDGEEFFASCEKANAAEGAKAAPEESAEAVPDEGADDGAGRRDEAKKRWPSNHSPTSAEPSEASVMPPKGESYFQI